MIVLNHKLMNLEKKRKNVSKKGFMVQFIFSKKAKKIEEIFTVDLIVCSKFQIDVEDSVKFCGLLRKHKL